MIRCCISSVILPPLPPVYRSLGVSYSSLSVVYYACGLVRFSSLHTCPSLSRSLTGNLLCFANSFISRPTTPPHPAENHITSILSYVAIVVKACITSPIHTSTSCTCGITLPYILHHHHIQYQHLCEAPIELHTHRDLWKIWKSQRLWRYKSWDEISIEERRLCLKLDQTR